MKRPFVAFLLSFGIPGAGLVYIGKWKWGLLNLGAVVLIGLVAALTLADDDFEKYRSYIAVGCAGGSAALADMLAKQLNEKAKAGADRVPTQP